jgi:aspartate aminotransferase
MSMKTLALPVSAMAHGLVGSEILKIAAEIRARFAKGEKIVNLTVGDYRPDLFPIPEGLRAEILRAFAENQTNYPPSDGLPELRQAVADFYEERLGLRYPAASVVIASGVRPALYGTFRTFLDPGDTLVFPVPSWNNNHYAWLCGANPRAIVAGAEVRFLPTAELLASHLADARMLALCSPLNPAGTCFGEAELERIVALILDENARREESGRPPLILLYDMVYWMLTFGGTKHVTPVGIDPRMRAFTILCDGISKGLSSTGLRVGWAVGPEAYMKPFSDIVGHVGAWAPRPEQWAVARFLKDAPAVDGFVAGLKAGVIRRLDALHAGFEAMRADGYPVRSIPPGGAIYLSARFDLIGRRWNGRTLATNEDIRVFLLAEAAMAVVPFQAFGLREDTGWFRLSVGALPDADLERLFPALRAALDRAR